MFTRIISLLKKKIMISGIKNTSLKKKSSVYVSSPPSSNIEELQLHVRNPEQDKIYLKVGENSLVCGTFIFETKEGIVTIGDRSYIGSSTFLSIEKITIGNDVMISWGCTLIDNNSHSLIWTLRRNDVLDWKKGVESGGLGVYKNWEVVERKPIIIKDKAWIGFNSILLKGVTIGEGAIVGAGSLVTKNVPDWTIVAGNPAKVIRIIPDYER